MILEHDLDMYLKDNLVGNLLDVLDDLEFYTDIFEPLLRTSSSLQAVKHAGDIQIKFWGYDGLPNGSLMLNWNELLYNNTNWFYTP